MLTLVVDVAVVVAAVVVVVVAGRASGQLVVQRDIVLGRGGLS